MVSNSIEWVNKVSGERRTTSRRTGPLGAKSLESSLLFLSLKWGRRRSLFQSLNSYQNIEEAEVVMEEEEEEEMNAVGLGEASSTRT